jgi:hypothetical protein
MKEGLMAVTVPVAVLALCCLIILATVLLTPMIGFKTAFLLSCCAGIAVMVGFTCLGSLLSYKSA